MTSAAEAGPQIPGAVGFRRHDHDACIARAMATAEGQCAARKVQFTPVRQRVLEILLQEHRALGAYEVLARLDREGLGSQPPVAYRALDFLVAHGFVHRIERLNAFIACAHPGTSHAPAFLICRQCSAVAEAQAAPAKGALGTAARRAGFAIESTMVEAEGLCPGCRDAGTA